WLFMLSSTTTRHCFRHAGHSSRRAGPQREFGPAEPTSIQPDDSGISFVTVQALRPARYEGESLFPALLLLYPASSGVCGSTGNPDAHRSGCDLLRGRAMSRDGGERIVREVYEALAAHDVDAAAERMANDVLVLNVATGDVYRGRAGFLEYSRGWAAALPDIRLK